jgi:hypothetical protein
VPSLKEIKRGMKNRDKKENIVYRIVFDVVGSYLKEYDGPNYKVKSQ